MSFYWIAVPQPLYLPAIKHAVLILSFHNCNFWHFFIFRIRSCLGLGVHLAPTFFFCQIWVGSSPASTRTCPCTTQNTKSRRMKASPTSSVQKKTSVANASRKRTRSGVSLHNSRCQTTSVLPSPLRAPLLPERTVSKRHRQPLLSTSLQHSDSQGGCRSLQEHPATEAPRHLQISRRGAPLPVAQN